LYIASRTLYGLASDGSAPAIFKRTDKRGVPIYSLGFSACFGLLAFMNVSKDAKTVFGYFVNLTTIFGLLTWISILTTHIWFLRARKAQGIPNNIMPYTAPLGIYGTYFALGFCILIALTKNFDVFVISVKGYFDYATFITSYLGIPLYLILIFGHKLVTKSKGIKPHEADFYTGKDIIDREEEEFLARKAAKMESSGANNAGWFYRHFVSWLF
jgi:amino acid transporter